MKCRPADLRDDLGTLPQLPARVTRGGSESPETVAFLSGAVLGQLDVELWREEAPLGLLGAGQGAARPTSIGLGLVQRANL